MLDGDNEETIRWAADRGMGVMTYGTLGGGILTGSYRKIQTFGETDNRNRFYPYFREPLFSKVMELLKVMDAIAAERMFLWRRLQSTGHCSRNLSHPVLPGPRAAARLRRTVPD
mgnify:CR=1 FL=1